MELIRGFPDDDACLDYLWRTRYAEDGEHAECPKCEQVRPFKRYETTQRRQSWTCTACGRHFHPTERARYHRGGRLASRGITAARESYLAVVLLPGHRSDRSNHSGLWNHLGH